MTEPYELVLGQMARKIDLLQRELREARTLESGYTMGDAIGAGLGLPGLRAFWPFSSINQNGTVIDISGQARALTNTNAATFGVQNQVMPYAILNGTTQYFTRADEVGQDITGSLTMGGWFYTTSIANAIRCIGKDVAGTNNRSYSISLAAGTGQVSMSVFPLGTSASEFSIGGSSIAINTWTFLVGRFTSSTELAVWVNNTKTSTTTAVPAATFSGAAPFTIGASGTPDLYLPGRATLCFLCADALPDALINRFYNISRSLMGV